MFKFYKLFFLCLSTLLIAYFSSLHAFATNLGKAESLMVYNIFCPLFTFDEETNGYKLIQDQEISLDGAFDIYPGKESLISNNLNEEDMEAIKSDMSSLKIKAILSKRIYKFLKISQRNGFKQKASFGLGDLSLEEVENPFLLPQQSQEISSIDFSASTPFIVNPKRKFINSFVEDREAREVLLAGGSVSEDKIDLYKQIIIPIGFKLRKTKGTIFEKTLFNNRDRLLVVLGAEQPVFTFP